MLYYEAKLEFFVNGYLLFINNIITFAKYFYNIIKHNHHIILYDTKNRIMKKKGSRSDFMESRNENLRREFFARLGRNGRTLNQLFDDLSHIGADRFYISEERALRLIRELETIESSGNNMKTKRRVATRTRMVAEIRRRAYAMMQATPGLSLKDAVFEVVNSPAPAFYLTPGSIRTILYTKLRS